MTRERVKHATLAMLVAIAMCVAIVAVGFAVWGAGFLLYHFGGPWALGIYVAVCSLAAAWGVSYLFVWLDDVA